MHKISLGLLSGAAILGATAFVYAQSATPIEGNRSVVRPAPSGATTGTAPNSAVTNQVGTTHQPGGNPDRAPASTQTHEPPAR
jgi:hypothetical protein